MASSRNKSNYLVGGMILLVILVWFFYYPVPSTQSVNKSLTASFENLPETIKSAFNRNVDQIVSKDTVPNSKAYSDTKSLDHSSPIIPVYIVEEHHEVIPYWFKAAKEGKLPTRGNVLVHIDGHPDTVTPNFEEGLPIFNQPKTPRHLTQLMQSNDDFIMSSVYAGFISRMIWIYPSWNKDFDNNRVTMIGFGYVFGRTFEDELPLCYCEELLSESDNMGCYHIDTYDEESHHKKIPRSDCQVKQIVMYEEIIDYKAEELSQSDDWIPSTDNVFFDIDEDYYGCQAAFQYLLDVKITEKYVDDVLGPGIESLFCPGDAKAEHAFDKIFYDLLRRVTDKHGVKKLQEKERNDIIKNTIQSIKQRNLTAELCSETNVDVGINKLILNLNGLNKDQLQALAKLGICLKTTSRTPSFDRMNGMKLCDGYNRPNNDSAVFFHTPSLDEIIERTKQMESILRKLPEPKMVTICRSSRDGYVPGQFVSKIETDIIQTLVKVFPNITGSSLHYDAELHGGKQGWHKRHGDIPW
ncbi:uncharacterized protein LOC126829811 [Patella vulgata]|uniref:uncharacterized protein LOC126829811 n=1 Tax=Patella vulgata TaxID=6465 RepID=UPI00218056C2|nr:uncharacterized protein LOC126829811 [Patella vulgata]